VLLDLREPHEVKLGSEPDGLVDGGEMLPGIEALILHGMRKGSRCSFPSPRAVWRVYNVRWWVLRVTYL
jgi:hypothetical protein